MAPSDTPLIESGDLSICPELREVINSRGESVRLGPINMNVLALLVSRPGQIVTRNELFDAVWKNQVINDDVLTRCISDIRAQLNRLSGTHDHIETLPKRGYRWVAEVPRTFLSSEAVRKKSVGEKSIAKLTPASFPLRAVLGLLSRCVVYLSALVLLATLGVWLMNQLSRPNLPVIAVLPTEGEASERELVASIENQLSAYLTNLDQVDLLSRSAVESRPNNPFPYFHYEFGARWLVESELRRFSGRTVLTLLLVDARTGIVLFQSTESISNDGSPAGPNVERIIRRLESFIKAQLER